MKIAFYHELHKGGARRGTNEFARQLKSRGHTVDLYIIGRNKDLSEYNYYNHIFFYNFKPKIWEGHNWKRRLYKDTIELIKILFLNRKIAKNINKKNYDLTYIAASQYIESPFILQFLKMPKFFFCNDPYYRIIYEPELFNKKKLNKFKIFYEYVNRFIRKYIDRWNIKKADYIISVSEFVKKSFNSVYGKTEGHVINYGVDVSFFTPKKIEKDIDILYIGSYDFLDGYPLFKEIIGNFHFKPKIREIMFENEWLTDTQIRDIYRRTKIFVATSFKEPLGLVPLEAMSCGAVVVAVDDGGHRETVVNKQTGFVVKKKSTKIYQKINWLLKNPAERKRMSLNARRYVLKNWSWENKGGELEKYLFKKIKYLKASQ